MMCPLFIGRCTSRSCAPWWRAVGKRHSLAVESVVLRDCLHGASHGVGSRDIRISTELAGYNFVTIHSDIFLVFLVDFTCVRRI